MAHLETLEEFYGKKQLAYTPANLPKGAGHFNVFNLENCLRPDAEPLRYSRRDFYKISLIRGDNIYHYADKSIRISGSTLIFFNPRVPYTWESVSGGVTGFFCIFTEAFFTESTRSSIGTLPMFAAGSKPSYVLNRQQDRYVSQIFGKMLEEIGSDYRYKYDLLRTYVTEMLHYALKLEPSETLYQHSDANARITAVFTELLERQFPIESPRQPFTLRTPRDFAAQLSVHVNHLNRAVKLTTGKTTTQHIAERIAGEARALLKHTNWNVAEIGYSLGFEDPSHFNNFFKKQVAVTPAAYRQA